MSAGPVEVEILRELAQTAGVEVSGAPVPGCHVELRALRAGRAAAGGQVVVLLHGRGHAGSVWFPHIEALAARQPVLAPDLPGFGASGAAPLGPGAGPEDAVGFFVDPIEALLAGEIAAGRARSFVLVGHSLGGLVAVELALRGRLPVVRLALIDPMGLGPLMTLGGRLFFRLHPERLATALGRRLFERLNRSPPTPLGRRIAALEYELLTARSPSRRTAARAFDLLCPLTGPVFSRREDLSHLKGSVLVLWGERDAALPSANAGFAALRVAGAQIVSFPALGHSPHLEAPHQVLPALLDFI
jgi:pimeloyl-ACP methyl ester carboxylesterase